MDAVDSTAALCLVCGLEPKAIDFQKPLPTGASILSRAVVTFFFMFSHTSRLLAEQVEVDGRKLALPEDLAGVLFLNIPSYMGGVDLWAGGDLPATAGPFAPQSFSDARLEACARLTLVEVMRMFQAAACML